MAARSAPPHAILRRGNTHGLAVLGHRAAGDRNPGGFQAFSQARVRQRLARVFGVDQLSDHRLDRGAGSFAAAGVDAGSKEARSEEHTSELQSLMRISYAVFCLKKKKKISKTA